MLLSPEPLSALMTEVRLVLVAVNVKDFVSPELVLPSKALATSIAHVVLALFVHLQHVAPHLVAIANH